MLLDDAGAGVNDVEEGQYYFFEYVPKFKDILKEWDQYPLIKVVDKKTNILGANLHYVSAKQRLGVLNNRNIPKETLHYYIPRRSDTSFYQLTEADAVVLSQLPLDKFHRNNVTHNANYIITPNKDGKFDSSTPTRRGLSYPANLASIPYASYLKIRKYTYDEGMAKVAKNQDDALGIFQNSTLAKDLIDATGGAFKCYVFY